MSDEMNEARTAYFAGREKSIAEVVAFNAGWEAAREAGAGEFDADLTLTAKPHRTRRLRARIVRDGD